MAIRITKLTPPQIQALREVMPSCVEAGVLTTTNSIATFSKLKDKDTDEELSRERYEKIVLGFCDMRPVDLRLQAVARKIRTRPDLIVEA